MGTSLVVRLRLGFLALLLGVVLLALAAVLYSLMRDAQYHAQADQDARYASEVHVLLQKDRRVLPPARPAPVPLRGVSTLAALIAVGAGLSLLGLGLLGHALLQTTSSQASSEKE
ncbi:MAG: hypothetical protein U0840_01810 [Gemmataceae bacterium]